MRQLIEVPAAFARSTLDREGEHARGWLEGIPALAGGLLERWECSVAGPAHHGFVGIVIPVWRRDRSAAVLKLSWPHPGNVAEVVALSAWGGAGAVRVLERADESFAMLLEQLEQQSLTSMADVDAAVAIAARIARRLAVPAPPGVPRLSSMCERWVEELPAAAEALGNPLPGRVLSAAVATCADLGPEQPDTLLHGDLHLGNVLRGAREPWLVIDPRAAIGEVAWEGITLMRERWKGLVGAGNLRLSLVRRLSVFADAAEVDVERARRWAQVRAVADGHWSRQHDEPAMVTAALDQVAILLA